jgi:hypothetical protein
MLREAFEQSFQAKEIQRSVNGLIAYDSPFVSRRKRTGVAPIPLACGTAGLLAASSRRARADAGCGAAIET